MAVYDLQEREQIDDLKAWWKQWSGSLSTALLIAALIVAGVQLIALGLPGELQVRHFHEPTKRAPYTVDRVLRSSHSQGALAD